MPYTVAHLRDAIDAIDLPQIRRIIEERDHQDRPTVNVNNIIDHRYNNNFMSSAVNYALGQVRSASHRFNILNILLAARDANNNPLVDLLAPNGMGAQPLEWIIESGQPQMGQESFTREQIRTLADTILNLRDARGNRVYQFSVQSAGPLIHAITLGDPAIVRLLLDLREANGSFTIDPNSVLHWGARSMRALDVAIWGNHWRVGGVPGHVPNQEILDLLRQYGGVRFEQELPRRAEPIQPIPELPPEMPWFNAAAAVAPMHEAPFEWEPIQPIPEFPPEMPWFNAAAAAAPMHEAPFEWEPLLPITPRTPIPVQQPNIAADQFNANSQNVHSPAVEKTVEAAINKLKKRYGSPRDHLNPDILSYIDQMEDKRSDYPHIQRAAQYIMRNGSAVHGPTGLSLLQILNLVWQGINDKKAPPPGTKMTDQILALRREALLDQLRDITQTYRNVDGTYNASCIGGSRNRILLALDKAHPDVSIAPTSEALQEIFFEKVIDFEREFLSQRPHSQQLEVLRNWEKLSDGEEGEASRFHEQFKIQFLATHNDDIEQFYANILGQRYLDDFFDPLQFNNLPQPIPHVGLRRLVDKIQAVDAQTYPFAAQMVKKASLAPYVDQLFNENYSSFEEALSWLESKCELYGIFEEIDKNINALKNIQAKKRTVSAALYEDVTIVHRITDCIQSALDRHDFSTSPSILRKNISKALNSIEMQISPDEAAIMDKIKNSLIPSNLKVLIAKINAFVLPSIETNPCVHEAIIKDSLILRAQTVFDEEHRSYDEDFTWLQTQFDILNPLYDLCRNIDTCLFKLKEVEQKIHADAKTNGDLQVSQAILNFILDAIRINTPSDLIGLKRQSTFFLNNMLKTKSFKELESSDTGQQAFQILKNTLLVLPIGWPVLAYRGSQGDAFFDTRAQIRRALDGLYTLISAGIPKDQAKHAVVQRPLPQEERIALEPRAVASEPEIHTYQKIVLVQNHQIASGQVFFADDRGDESCGYHAMKNALLSLLYINKMIGFERYTSALNSPNLFQSLFQKMKTFADGKKRAYDLSPGTFLALLSRVKNGEFDFSQHFITRKMLMSLNLEQNGSENISIANFYTQPGAATFGLGGMENDLFNMAAILKLIQAKQTGQEISHVFACGINDEHWVTATVTQNAVGLRVWTFMDSMKNQPTFQKVTIQQMESILNYSYSDLRRFLLVGYEASSDLFLRRYHSFFNEMTGEAIAEPVGGFVNHDSFGEHISYTAHQFFIENKSNQETYITWIKNRFSFMKIADWLSSSEVEETAHVKRLAHIARFMFQNIQPDHANAQELRMICDALSHVQFRDEMKSEEAEISAVDVQQWFLLG